MAGEVTDGIIQMNYSSFNSTENYGRRSDGIVKRLCTQTARV